MDGVDTMTTPRAKRNFGQARMENLLCFVCSSHPFVRSVPSVLVRKLKVVE